MTNRRSIQTIPTNNFLSKHIALYYKFLFYLNSDIFLIEKFPDSYILISFWCSFPIAFKFGSIQPDILMKYKTRTKRLLYKETREYYFIIWISNRKYTVVADLFCILSKFHLKSFDYTHIYASIIAFK